MLLKESTPWLLLAAPSSDRVTWTKITLQKQLSKAVGLAERCRPISSFVQHNVLIVGDAGWHSGSLGPVPSIKPQHVSWADRVHIPVS